MSDPSSAGPGPLVGILVMDARIARIPGDAGNPATFPFPVACRKVPGATLERLIRKRDPSLLAPFVEAGSDLVREGARALTTTCGFMILFQEDLAARLPVPVFTSSLLQLPFIQRLLGPCARIGVITADAANLTAEHLRMAGADPDRLAVCGLEDQPRFREAIFGGQGRLDRRGVEAEVVATASRMVNSDPAIRALLFECANLPPYAAAVQAAVGLPVFDIVTMIHHVHSALARTPFGP
ncbi:MAG: aspartate/glutamate racemase family protein [Desulfobacterales bacterium]